MFKKILFLAISLFCVTSCFAFSKAIKLGEPYNGAVKDSIFVDDAYGNKYIVVEKGCATWFYENKLRIALIGVILILQVR